MPGKTIPIETPPKGKKFTISSFPKSLFFFLPFRSGIFLIVTRACIRLCRMLICCCCMILLSKIRGNYQGRNKAEEKRDQSVKSRRKIWQRKLHTTMVVGQTLSLYGVLPTAKTKYHIKFSPLFIAYYRVANFQETKVTSYGFANNPPITRTMRKSIIDRQSRKLGKFWGSLWGSICFFAHLWVILTTRQASRRNTEYEKPSR